MSAASQLIFALNAPSIRWVAHENVLTAIFPEVQMVFMVCTNGRTFVCSPEHNGAWRWWPWTRWRVARAARARYAAEVAKRREAKPQDVCENDTMAL